MLDSARWADETERATLASLLLSGAAVHGAVAHGSSLHDAVREIGEMQARLPAATSVLLGVAALGAATLPGLWAVTQHVNIMAHEGAHAMMGSATGRTVRSVKMHGNGTGATDLTRAEGAGFALAAVVGYLGPSAFGLGAAKLIQVGHIVAVLWFALVALAALVIVARRSAFGLTAVILTGLLVYLAARYEPVGIQVGAAYAIAWFLLLSGIRVVLAHGRGAGDAGVLHQLTRLPRGVWAALWLAGSAAALAEGARLLV